MCVCACVYVCGRVLVWARMRKCVSECRVRVRLRVRVRVRRQFDSSSESQSELVLTYLRAEERSLW